jgi:transposase-like protein
VPDSTTIIRQRQAAVPARATSTPAVIDRIRADMAAGRSRREIAADIGVGESAITKWVRKHNLGTFRIGRVRPAPSDFAEHAARETRTHLQKRYRVGHHVLAQWCAAVGRVPMRGGSPIKHAPDGFALIASQHSLTDLARRYGVSTSTVSRWSREVGVTRTRGGERKTDGKTITPASVPKLQAYHRATPTIVHRDLSTAGMAADYLRRLGPVVRCDDAGRYDPAGSHYRRGSTVLTHDEVIARAERLGWAA